MSAVSSWISQVVLLILLAIVLELLLPNDSFQKYVKLVVGLVLIVALLSPVIKVLHMPVEKILNELNPPKEEDALKNSINQHKNEIEHEQAAYKSNIVAVYMKNDVQEALGEQFGLTIVGDIHLDIDDSAKSPKVKHAVVVLGQADEAKKAAKNNQERSDKTKEIQPVKKVDIQVRIDDTETDRQSSSQETKELKAVKAFLAKKWEIPQSRLTLQLEGGGS
ncbi:hypothetical protein GCM10011391_26710 [Pullulanibacillus camelliae]|uniref:Stage III sporulation protein AF n=1 Tax=Pullulanibacillus camelliae TaxID=1707096 RepID=A0A8J2YJ59_9BACL|nr:stage III sporulation protein AF [Pullulanibacillus camelliae]GGE46573.1 hypothetical protein GCM10011391_26710 [Pullulanibacillus camelliae]